MMTAKAHHEPAVCNDPLCQRCESYQSGYSHGKAKAHAEVRQWESGAHSESCGCEPCKTARAVLLKGFSRRD